MDDKKLALLAEKLGITPEGVEVLAEKLGITPEEVEAEVEKRLKLGNPKCFAEIASLVGLLVQLLQVAREIWPKTREERVAMLEEKAAPAHKVDEKERGKVIHVIVELKTLVSEPCK